ncbi:hypothetical protein [Bythopirellula polymerisocia]|uniref:Uncharacterized protein n=1 Tax=Bythopirellula polymerisocia TaxID=2528003 RepID=A0A5C6D2D7_9BACT|nr:hypothetical protein [Bythopirellula polymerisocia]TWU29376.1 hypothetical protein Pla144_01530 [Bythopirellula polymerisocia]
MHTGLEKFVLAYVKDRPEFVEAVVERVVAEHVERLLEERREFIETGISKRMLKSLQGVATQEYLNLFVASQDKGRSLKPLSDVARDEARKRVTEMMRLWHEELVGMHRDLKQLREIVQSDDADWWKRKEKD